MNPDDRGLFKWLSNVVSCSLLLVGWFHDLTVVILRIGLVSVSFLVCLLHLKQQKSSPSELLLFEKLNVRHGFHPPHPY